MYNEGVIFGFVDGFLPEKLIDDTFEHFVATFCLGADLHFTPNGYTSRKAGTQMLFDKMMGARE
jgi:hypothetical protein